MTSWVKEFKPFPRPGLTRPQPYPLAARIYLFQGGFDRGTKISSCPSVPEQIRPAPDPLLQESLCCVGFLSLTMLLPQTLLRRGTQSS